MPRPAAAHPLDRARTGTPGRARAGSSATRPAVAAALDVQLVALAGLPEALRLLVDARQRLLVRLRVRHRSGPPQDQRRAAVPQAEHAAGAVARARPRVRHLARRRTRRAAACTASITRKMPRMPGWFDDRPPPSVLTGSAPPRPMRPSSHERAALARLAEAEVLERHQHGDRERVVDHAQVDVGVRHAGHRRGARARLLRGDVE